MHQITRLPPANLQEESSDGTTEGKSSASAKGDGTASVSWWADSWCSTIASNSGSGSNGGWDWNVGGWSLSLVAGWSNGWLLSAASSFAGGWHWGSRGGGNWSSSGGWSTWYTSWDGDTGGQAEFVGSLSSLFGISWGACLQDASGGARNELFVGARALEVGQVASGGLEGWEEASLSASWDISDALGRGNSRDGNKGNSRELHFECIKRIISRIILKNVY